MTGAAEAAAAAAAACEAEAEAEARCRNSCSDFSSTISLLSTARIRVGETEACSAVCRMHECTCDTSQALVAQNRTAQHARTVRVKRSRRDVVRASHHHR